MIRRFIKNHKIITTLIVVVVIIVVVFALFAGKGSAERESVTVTVGNISQEISVTGRVEAAEKVELSSESRGKVTLIPVQVGDSVVPGTTLIKINTDDLNVLIRRQQADLEKSRIALAKLEFKTTSEDDLEKAYEDGFNAVADAFVDLPSIVTGLREIIRESYLSSNLSSRYGDRAVDFRDVAYDAYFEAKRQYDAVLKEYRAANRGSSDETIEDLVSNSYDMVQTVADTVKDTNLFIDYVEKRANAGSLPAQAAIDQESIDTYTEQTNDHLVALLDIKDIINDSRDGITDEDQDIESLRLDIRQVELDIEDTLVQIGRRIIRSPINGVVTSINVKVGETISENEFAVSVITSDQFQIEAFLPESDIAKANVGSDASIILDAYGNDVIFQAKVVLIDPAETIVDGVATYKLTLEFVSPDPRIRSGMTSDIKIQGESRESVLIIPQRAVKTRMGKKYVEILEGEVVTEVEIKTGLRGTDGNVEVLDGLYQGDLVVVS